VTAPLSLHPDRLLGTEPGVRAIARELYAAIAGLPIVSPHGHTDPGWFAENEPFADPTSLLVTPDHYLLRMLYSQGVPMEALGVSPKKAGSGEPAKPRDAWRTFAAHFHLFRGTPSGLWLNHVLAEVFGVGVRLTADTADEVYDHLADRLAHPEFRPRALLDRFGIEVLATTDSPLSTLQHHVTLAADGLTARIRPTFRPDSVIDPEGEHYRRNVEQLGATTGRDTTRWGDYLAALWDRRQAMIALGATSTDHGPPTAHTADLSPAECQALLDGALAATLNPHQAEQLRGHMLVEMARMSIEDGLVMQLHAGARRNHNRELFERYGRDMGGDVPGPVDFVGGLKALLDRLGNDHRLRVVLFTLDESTFTRELAPLAGHYPTLFLGPPWWFLDSVEGMARQRRAVIETAGFANCTGFVDDTRAFMSIPARHDVARRVDCRFLAELVADHRLELDEAHEIAIDLAGEANRRVFKLGSNGERSTTL
jgi:glucuronate isomerase